MASSPARPAQPLAPEHPSAGPRIFEKSREPTPSALSTVSASPRASAPPTGASSREALVHLAASHMPLPSPVEAYFEVANRCNSKCATCPLTFSPQEAAAQLSLDDFKSLVAQLPDLRRAVLQGIGEPLLNRDLAAMIAHLKERGVYTVFNTNAALLTRKRQVELIESGLDELRVSLDSSTPEMYLKVRGIAAFDRVIANVAESVRTRRELASTTPRFSIWMTALRENLPELPAVVDLAGQLGVDEVYLQRLVYWGQGLATADQSVFHQPTPTPASPPPDAQRVSQAAAEPTPPRVAAGPTAPQAATEATPMLDAEAIIAEAERRAAAYGMAFRGADARPPRDGLLGAGHLEHEPWRACSRPLRLAYITAQGTALPCCIAPFTDAPYDSIRLGNYLRDGIEAVWQGAAYQRFREQLYSSTPPASCRNCGLAWSL